MENRAQEQSNGSGITAIRNLLESYRPPNYVSASLPVTIRRLPSPPPASTSWHPLELLSRCVCDSDAEKSFNGGKSWVLQEEKVKKKKKKKEEGGVCTRRERILLANGELKFLHF